MYCMFLIVIVLTLNAQVQFEEPSGVKDCNLSANIELYNVIVIGKLTEFNRSVLSSRLNAHAEI